MIFKVFNEEVNEWVIFDNIRKVRSRCDKVKWHEGLFFGEDGFDIQADHSFVECNNEKNADVFGLGAASCQFNNGEEKTFVFKRAYLLNDEGKTIEVL